MCLMNTTSFTFKVITVQAREGGEAGKATPSMVLPHHLHPPSEPWWPLHIPLLCMASTLFGFPFS